MKKTLCTLLLLLSFPLAARAAHPSYAGTWILDLAASSSMPERYREGIKEWRLDFEQTPELITATIHIDREGWEPLNEVHPIRLDGTAATFDTTARTPDGPVTVPMTSRGSVDEKGNVHVELTGEMKGPQGTMKRVTFEELVLSDGGKTLTIHRRDEGMGPAREFDMVFRRAEQ
jgi:hypothetical protein